MNKAELVAEISAQSGVNAADCEKVLAALEKVLENDLTDSKGIGAAFDKVYAVMRFLRGGKDH